jgi:uncharacterized cupredoxin-like copper-binding protein
MKKFAGLMVFVLVLSMALSACGGSKGATLDVEMTDFAFNPATYEVPAGSEVTLNLTNSGTVEHEFAIMKLGTQATTPFDDDDEGNVYWETSLQPGQSSTVTFTAPSEAGDYEIVCGIPAHIEQGMTGTLTVK